jgi:GMP synthase-like glutamine amidotransferase
MKIHYLQHVHFEGLGYIESWLHENEVTVSSSRAFEYARFPELAEFDGLIVLGGPMSVNDVDLYPWLKREIRFIADTIAVGKPVLGICLGAQLIAKAMSPNVDWCRVVEATLLVFLEKSIVEINRRYIHQSVRLRVRHGLTVPRPQNGFCRKYL